MTVLREKHKSDARFHRYTRDFHTKRVGAMHKIPPFNSLTIHDFPERTTGAPKRRHIPVVDLAEDPDAVPSLGLVALRRPRNSPSIDREPEGGGGSDPREDEEELQEEQEPEDEVRGGEGWDGLSRKDDDASSIREGTPESDIVTDPGFE